MCFPFLSSPLLSSPSSPSSRLPPFPPSLPPLSAAHLSDLETSVDSRCTTDSADSAFIGRRYWFLPSPFYHFCSQIILLRPPHTRSKPSSQTAGATSPPQNTLLFWYDVTMWIFSVYWFFFFQPSNSSSPPSDLLGPYRIFVFMALLPFNCMFHCLFALMFYSYLTLWTPY